MKKSLIALAIAGAFAAPAFAATSNVDVYGVMNLSVEDTNADNVDFQVTDRQSRIGFKGAEDLGGGLKGIWQIEQAISNSAGGQDGVGGTALNANNTGSGGGATFANRNTFVGLSGGFGTVLMGRHDTPYKLTTAGKLDIFADTMADVNAAGNLNNHGNSADATTSSAVQLVSATHDIRSGNAVAYVSPNFSGFGFAGAVVFTNADAGANSTDAYSLSATYENGPLYAAFGYQDLVDASQAWKIGAGYSFGDAKVGFVYEDVDNEGNVVDRDSWVLNGAYNMGPMVLKAQFGQADVGNADQSKWSLGVDYNMSKRTTAFFVFDSNDNDGPGDSLNGYAVGVKHSF